MRLDRLPPPPLPPPPLPQELLRVGRDRRPVMRSAMELFDGTADAAPLQRYAEGSDPGDKFYASLYLGLVSA